MYCVHCNTTTSFSFFILSCFRILYGELYVYCVHCNTSTSISVYVYCLIFVKDKEKCMCIVFRVDEHHFVNNGNVCNIL